MGKVCGGDLERQGATGHGNQGGNPATGQGGTSPPQGVGEDKVVKGTGRRRDGCLTM